MTQYNSLDAIPSYTGTHETERPIETVGADWRLPRRSAKVEKGGEQSTDVRSERHRQRLNNSNVLPRHIFVSSYITSYKYHASHCRQKITHFTIIVVQKDINKISILTNDAQNVTIPCPPRNFYWKKWRLVVIFTLGDYVSLQLLFECGDMSESVRLARTSEVRTGSTISKKYVPDKMEYLQE
ncbi:hypothetical protein PHYBLDRAFT_68177 [Phycomyces blakesleeanus NRRL 1555(-)]|uniref:Uncharacterized protein n=1 Tax=Phycomyces blakesleeanus (strain ATCC 8743b / DSM 1359 / FGSC 10004 / NBRC 33097 / NRRL 1555) TaxID=763407 RepID=A0A162TKB4_PHYB8|nr:hypothetical protein PHYBLDRAFT_68177 [Phycomyces blakesleeanus NRRL 1555(-)]OAD67803.1 hypothetical protein PHYBLDRAFT_68177 [Phycomyces blakesleeanus NRRL 1555(-)]|eukprot:XP_018285843.1 hypothetical protein PHYBLDRAFT_68177 [Phycomyces blakesleeanus NRRL 1555(-)]